MILEGTTSSGAVVPVQVTADGKVVAEGRTGPQGPPGPEGPQGPPGPDSPIWDRNGTVVSPTNDGDSLELTSGSTAGVSLNPGSTGKPFVRNSDGRIGVGTATPGGLLDVTEASNNGNATDNVSAYFESVNRNANLHLVSNENNTSSLYFGDQASNLSGRVAYANNTDSLIFGTNGSAVNVAINSAGRLLVGPSLATPAVSLDPGSTGVPLVRDAEGRLLVGLNNAPAGTVAGDVVCQGAVVLQSPNGMWWAIEVEDNGTLSVSQTTVR